MLYLIATPIGNLSDISFRAIEVLNDCDYILCEDTRHSKKLLDHYTIRTRTLSYHKFNEASKVQAVINDLKSGKTIALISDAGTPGISDPGERLVAACIEEQVSVSTIPGCCACIAALSISGFNTTRFQFLGFPPRKDSELKQTLIDTLMYPGTSIFYEAPNRLINFLSFLKELSPNRTVCIARELTKKFETVIRGTPEQLIATLSETPLKGECVVLISEDKTCTAQAWHDLSPEEHVAYLSDTYSLSRLEAIKLSASLRGVPKREIYKKFHS